MSVAPETPAGDLDVRNEPIVFTTTNLVTSISVEFNPDDGTGPRETVYDGTDAANLNGTFAHVYRDSERDGNEWTIRRETGWPAPFKIAIKEASAPSAPVASLSPTLLSPLVQWGLQGAPDVALAKLDRSGNARHLASGSVIARPSLVPGQTAVRGVLNGFQPAVAVVGDVTVTGMIKFAGGSGSKVIIDVGSPGLGCVYLVSCFNGKLTYYCQIDNMGTAASWQSNLAPVVDQWHWFKLRRLASGKPYLTLDGTTEEGPALAPPVALAGNGQITLGSNDGNVENWGGDYYDVNVWGAALNDTQTAPMRDASLGL